MDFISSVFVDHQNNIQYYNGHSASCLGQNLLAVVEVTIVGLVSVREKCVNGNMVWVKNYGYCSGSLYLPTLMP